MYNQNQVNLPSSVTQTVAHENTSARYQFVSTASLINRFEEQGLVVRSARQGNSKKYAGFQKHVVRLSMPGQNMVGDTKPEILIINSHNGGGSLQFCLGLYRLVCSNGLIAGSDIANVRVRHFGDNVQQIVEDALNDLHTQLPFAAQTVEAMRNRELTVDEMALFAKQALELRGAPQKAVTNGTVQYIEQNLLVARRYEDRSNNLWETFNRIEENVLRGVHGLRKITSTDRDVDLNKGLWNIAESFLKAA